mgnify:CR=1 FL=1
MDKEKFRGDLDFDVKIRLSGAICSAVCILCRQLLFKDTAVPVIVTIIPAAIAALMGIIKVVAVPMDDVDDENDIERSMEEFKQEMAEYDKKNMALSLVTDIIMYADIFAVAAIMIMDK